MARKKTAPADQETIEQDAAPETPKAVAKPARVRLKNTKASNGTVGAIATPLQKDAAAWRAIGWSDAD